MSTEWYIEKKRDSGSVDKIHVALTYGAGNGQVAVLYTGDWRPGQEAKGICGLTASKRPDEGIYGYQEWLAAVRAAGSVFNEYGACLPAEAFITQMEACFAPGVRQGHWSSEGRTFSGYWCD